MPAYINEYDCWDCKNSNTCFNGNKGDICSVDGNSSMSYIKDRSNYKQHETKIKSVYDADYTFYSFPYSTSDAFGYTDANLRSQLGDDCYSFEEVSS